MALPDIHSVLGSGFMGEFKGPCDKYENHPELERELDYFFLTEDDPVYDETGTMVDIKYRGRYMLIMGELVYFHHHSWG